MSSPTFAYLSTVVKDSEGTWTTHDVSRPTTGVNSNATKGKSGHCRGDSLAERGFDVDYDTKEVERLVKEIRDGTIAEILLVLFVQWIFQDDKNYEEAKKYIRELGVDQVSFLVTVLSMLTGLMCDIGIRHLPDRERERAESRR